MRSTSRPIGRTGFWKTCCGAAVARRLRAPRQHCLGAADRGAGVPRRALRHPADGDRGVAGNRGERSLLRAGPRLWGDRVRVGLLERGPLGAGLRADPQPPADYPRPCDQEPVRVGGVYLAAEGVESEVPNARMESLWGE